MGNPKRDGHELKPPQPPQHLDGQGQASSRASPQIRVGNKDRAPEPRKNLTVTPRLTGQYRDIDNTFHLFVNQAGPHIEVLLAVVESGAQQPAGDLVAIDKLRTKTRLIRFGGDRQNPTDHIYDLYLEHPDRPIDDKSLACGSLDIIRQADKWRIRLFLDLGELAGKYDVTKLGKLANLSPAVADQIGVQPNLFENHVPDGSGSHNFRSGLWFPLTPAQRNKLPQHVLGARVYLNAKNYARGGSKAFGYYDLVRDYFTTASSIGLRQNIAAALDTMVAQIYSDAKLPSPRLGGIDDFHLGPWRDATLAILEQTTYQIPKDKDRSLLHHTQDIIDAMRPYLELPNFNRLLGLHKRQSADHYEIELHVIDPDMGDLAKVLKFLAKYLKRVSKEMIEKLLRRIPAGGFIGTAIIRKRASQESPPQWEAYYLIVLAGIKISGGYGGGSVEASASGWAEAAYGSGWKPNQLSGPAKLFDASVGVYGGSKGIGKSPVGVLTAFGWGLNTPPPLHFDMSGDATFNSWLPGISGSVTGYGGILRYQHSREFDLDDIEIPPDNQEFRYGFKSKSSPAHFPINGARLTPEAKQIVEIFAATELAPLRRNGMELRIEGSADQPGEEIKNEILSRNRAVSVFNYLKNILEDELPGGELDPPVPTDEKAEIAELTAKRKEKPEAPLTVPQSPHNVTIVAHGEIEGQSNQYIQAHRRVTVAIDSTVTLTLRRDQDH